MDSVIKFKLPDYHEHLNTAVLEIKHFVKPKAMPQNVYFPAEYLELSKINVGKLGNVVGVYLKEPVNTEVRLAGNCCWIISAILFDRLITTYLISDHEGVKFSLVRNHRTNHASISWNDADSTGTFADHLIKQIEGCVAVMVEAHGLYNI